MGVSLCLDTQMNVAKMMFLPHRYCIYSFLQGIMLVYDITNEKSFDNIKNWIRNIEEVLAGLCSLLYVLDTSSDYALTTFLFCHQACIL